jgi:hypothetical protein
MKKVETYSNWCYLDQLDGDTLEDGEGLRVRWPNGKETKEKAVVEKSSYMMSDMGSPYEMHVSKAFVEADVHGAKCLVRLVGQEIMCERINPLPKKEKVVSIPRKRYVRG